MKSSQERVINILYVSPFSHIGGGEMSILTIINNLDRGRFRPFLICYEDGPFVERAVARGIETLIFKRGGGMSEFSIIWKLARFIKENDIRVVHVNSLDIRAGLAAWLTGIRCVGHLRVVFPFTWRDRLFVRLSKITIAVSRTVVDEFCKHAEAYRSKLIIIPNVADIPSHISAAPLRHEFNIPKDDVLIGIVGRLDPFKGHTVFVNAAVLIKKRVRSVRFLVIGDVLSKIRYEKEYLEGLKKKIADSGLEDIFIFTGFRDDILNTIAALDVMVVPSRVIKDGVFTVTEGFGRVVIEAMGVGVPVVASDAGGLKEIIEDGVSGVIVPANDPAAIAEAVAGLLRDRERTNAITTAAKKRFDAFYSVKTLDMVYELYSQIAK